MHKNLERGSTKIIVISVIVILIIIFILWLLWGSSNNKTNVEVGINNPTNSQNQFFPLDTSNQRYGTTSTDTSNTYNQQQNTLVGTNQNNSDNTGGNSNSSSGSSGIYSNGASDGYNGSNSVNYSSQDSYRRSQLQDSLADSFITGSYFSTSIKNNNPYTYTNNYDSSLYSGNDYSQAIYNNGTSTASTSSSGSGSGDGGSGSAGAVGGVLAGTVGSLAGSAVGGTIGNAVGGYAGNAVGGTVTGSMGSLYGTGAGNIVGGSIGGSAAAGLGVAALGGIAGGAAASVVESNFGGQVTMITPCTCSAGTTLIYIRDVSTGMKQLLYVPGRSILYAYGNIMTPGTNVLGTYTTGGDVCKVYVAVGCAPAGITQGTIKMVGTSAI